jgi:hypothetical protein
MLGMSADGSRAPSVGVLVGACVAAPLEVAYLWHALPWGLLNLVLALLILLWPLHRLPLAPRQALRTAAWWAGLGLLGAYLFGVPVLLASLPALAGGLLGLRTHRRRLARLHTSAPR